MKGMANSPGKPAYRMTNLMNLSPLCGLLAAYHTDAFGRTINAKPIMFGLSLGQNPCLKEESVSPVLVRLLAVASSAMRVIFQVERRKSHTEDVLILSISFGLSTRKMKT
mmetsp:Transcript_26423/g.50178  ORF Transcript_26423/g.50178 Transcript_26423/m.50178 type:complete len:110 (+) Transcript_26423:290-619(+)